MEEKVSLRQKLKKFARSKWHSIPVGAIAITLIVGIVIGGTAYAAYNLLNGSANVTVHESITYAEYGDGDGTWADSTWTVDIYPAESKTMILQLNNAGSQPITVAGTIGTTTGITTSIEPLAGYTWVVPAHGSTYVQLTLTADPSIAPSSITLPISISR